MTIKAHKYYSRISAIGQLEESNINATHVLQAFSTWHMSGIQAMMHIPWESYPSMRSALIGGEVQRVDSASCCGSSMVKIVSKRSGESMAIEPMNSDRCSDMDR